MKATEQYFSVVLFIMLVKMILSCKSEDDWNPTMRRYRAVPSFLVLLLYIMLYKFVLNLDENES